jgi:hypothetical protein
MKNEMNEQDSLRLIADMIAQAKERFQKRNGNSIILWGYAIMILALANFVLLKVLDSEHATLSYCVWIATIFLFAGGYAAEARKAKKACVKNHIDNLVGNVWSAYFISNMVVLTSTFMLAIALRAYHGATLFLLIMPAIMTLTGLSLFVNGRAYRFRPFLYGAICLWLGALLSGVVVAVWKDQSLQFLVLALCMIAGFILPGHLLNRNSRRDV